MEQTLQSVTIGAIDDAGDLRSAAGLARLDPIAVSEFIRDIERLRI